MTALYVSRRTTAPLTEAERRCCAKSIQQFQLGEGSRGQRLLDRARKFGRRANDPLFADATALFIKEEQQHSLYLDAFLESQGIPRLSRHWVDSVFRKLRGLAGLEMLLTVLVTAEIIAVAYYQALRSATQSAALKIICTRILEDEIKHLEFQASMLARMSYDRSRAIQRILSSIHRLFLIGTIAVVWKEHRSVFKIGGYNFHRFREETLREFSEWSRARQTWIPPATPLNSHRMVGTAMPRRANSKAGPDRRNLA